MEDYRWEWALASGHEGRYTITINPQALKTAFVVLSSRLTIRAHLKEIPRPMKLTARIPVTTALLALMLVSVTGCNKLKSRDQLVKGVQAFKNARYEEAVNHFQTAISLDPESKDAK